MLTKTGKIVSTTSADTEIRDAITSVMMRSPVHNSPLKTNKFGADSDQEKRLLALEQDM
jgi:hypothetical protein